MVEISGLLQQEQTWRLAAALVAALMLYTYLRAPSWLWGPRATFWNPLRRLLLPVVDRIAKRHISAVSGGEVDYAEYELGNAEYVGRVEASGRELEAEIYRLGYIRMVLAALKTLKDGRVERGSWAKRDGWLARRQTHLIYFPTPPGVDGVDVYAHEEPNAVNPLTAWAHYTAKGYDPAAGVETVRATLYESDLPLVVPDAA